MPGIPERATGSVQPDEPQKSNHQIFCSKVSSFTGFRQSFHFRATTTGGQEIDFWLDSKDHLQYPGYKLVDVQKVNLVAQVVSTFFLAQMNPEYKGTLLVTVYAAEPPSGTMVENVVGAQVFS
jgi:hypothetical protein